MVGNLLARARQDAKKIVTNLGFQNDVFLINPLSMAFIQLKGLTSKHWIKLLFKFIPPKEKASQIGMPNHIFSLLNIVQLLASIHRHIF